MLDKTEIEAAVLGIPGLEISDLVVEGTRVTVSGTVKSAAAKEECQKMVSTIRGIEKLVNQLEVAEQKRPKIL